jgi:flavorubredoxin
MIFVEHAPWAWIHIYTRRVIERPRRLVDAVTGETLSISQALHRGVFASLTSDGYTQAGVHIAPASSEEIAAAVLEAVDLHLGVATLTAEEMAQQIEAKRLLTLAGAGLSPPAHVCTVGTISPSFLRSYPEWAS